MFLYIDISTGTLGTGHDLYLMTLPDDEDVETRPASMRIVFALQHGTPAIEGWKLVAADRGKMDEKTRRKETWHN